MLSWLSLGLLCVALALVARLVLRLRAARTVREAAEQRHAELEQRCLQLEESVVLLEAADSQRKDLERQLDQAQKLEAVGQLAGGIAHDFNNLLTAILGNAEILRMHASLGELREEVDEILRAGRRGAELVRQMLSFARRSPGQIVPIDLHQTIEDSISLLRRACSPRIFVHVQLEDESPIIEADPATLENALLNLGLNARDAMPDGGHLTLKTKQFEVTTGGMIPVGAPPDLAPGAWVRLTVEDTGTGMEDEVKAHLFEPFFTTKAPGKGTGLGLASVYGTIQLLGGRIVVDSVVGRGTVFNLWIPLTDKEAQVQEAAPDPNEVRRRAGHILLVDDDDAVRNVGKKLLVELGCTVSTAVDGLDALDFYQEHRRDIDLVVLDMQMPNLDGQGTFRELRRMNPKVRVLLVSGMAGREEAERCLGDGALDVLAKPFRLEDLSRAIARYGRLQRSPNATN